MRDSLKVKMFAKSDTRTGKPEVPEYLIIYRPPTVPFLHLTIEIKIKIKIKIKINKLKIKQFPLITDLRTLCPQYRHKIVMEDLNADLLSKVSEAEFLRDLINELTLKVVNQGPTNHVGNCHT